jgi:hypothetical protein
MSPTQQSARAQWLPIGIIALLMNAILIGVSQIEQLAVNGGLGWDGRTYSYIARHFPGLLNSPDIDYYFIQRLLPSAIVSTASKILHKELTNEFLIHAFTVLNILWINVTFFFTVKAAQRLGITGRAMVATLILTFCNVFVLKVLLYAPINTDAAGLAIGSALLYTYVSRRAWLIILVGILGAFTHPLLLLTSLFLFVFRNDGKGVEGVSSLSIRLSFLPYVIALGFLLSYTGLYLLRYDAITQVRVEGTTPVNMQLYFLSLLLASLYLFVICRFIISFRLIEHLIQELRWKNVLLAVAILVVVTTTQILLCHSDSRFGPKTFLLNLMVSGIRSPLQFLVAHISFWGIGILFIILLFKRYLTAVQEIGTGYLALILGLCIAGINSETRQYCFALPFLMLPMGLVLSRYRLTSLHVFSVAVLALALSKFWLVIGAPEIMGDIQQSPFQRYFLSFGPWISPRSYIIQLMLFILLSILLYTVLRRQLRSPFQLPREKRNTNTDH